VKSARYPFKTPLRIVPCCTGEWARGHLKLGGRWRCRSCVIDRTRRAIESLDPRFTEWARISKFVVSA